MSETASVALTAVAAFALGSIPFGLLIAKAKGIDIRDVGSGNIGATNVARNLGKRLGVVVLLLDAAKGAIPVAIILHTALVPSREPYLLTVAGIGAIAGHCFSPWLRFRGGKGVATSLGVFTVLAPFVTLGAGLVFAAVYKVSRAVSLGSITAALGIPLAFVALGRPGPWIALGAGAAVIVLVKHQSNIRRLLSGSELRV
jgi:glycerol-3-phosphate acyltransferase PlsY